MKRQLFYLILLIGANFISSCVKDELSKGIPSYDKSTLAGTVVPNIEIKNLLEGVYTSDDNQYVLKWENNRLSIFAKNNAQYSVLEVGINYKDSSIRMAGYTRSPLVNNSGVVYLEITKENGAADLMRRTRTGIKINGRNEISGRSRELSFQFSRAFSQKVLDKKDFLILAHRAGGRNSDNIPSAENSLNLIKEAPYMGSNGLEIDVQLSADKVPFIYHDEDINIRLTQKGPLIGTIEQYNWPFLRRYVKLIDGQVIPTLEEALMTVVDSTNLRFIWLDNKGSSSDFFTYTIPVIQKVLTYARSKNKKIFIVNGLPSEDVAEVFVDGRDYKKNPSLCEFSLDKAIEIGSLVYAPRWTLGTQNDEVSRAHNAGLKVFTWTLDLQDGMKQFLAEGNFDGILTNYPSMLAYEFYIQE